MKEEIVNERQCETEDEKIDIQQLLFKYIIHWPWFVGAVLVCLLELGYICVWPLLFIIYRQQF